MLETIILVLLRSLVVFLMLAVGLRTTPAAMAATWQQRGLVIRALLVLELGVPLLALLTVGLLPLNPLVAGIVALMAACPGAPLVLRLVRGRAVVIDIVVAVSLLAPLTVPAWIWIIDRALLLDLAARPWLLARVALVQVVLPLTVGLSVAAAFPGVAQKLARLFWAAFVFSLGVALIVVIYLGAPLLLVARPVAFVAVVLVVLGSILMGHWAGRPRLEDSGALAQAAVLGNPALALAVVAYSLPGFDVAALMAAYLLLRALILLPYQVLLRRWLRRRGGGAPAAGAEAAEAPT